MGTGIFSSNDGKSHGKERMESDMETWVVLVVHCLGFHKIRGTGVGCARTAARGPAA